MRHIWSYQWLRKPTELTNDILRRLFDCTQGVTEILVALFSLAQEVAISEDDGDTYGEISDTLIQECYDTSLVLLHPSIDALRSNSVRAMQIFEDLLPPGGISESAGTPHQKSEANEAPLPSPGSTEGSLAPSPSAEAAGPESTADSEPAAPAADGNDQGPPPRKPRKPRKKVPATSMDPEDVRGKAGMEKALQEKGKIPGAPM